MSQPDSLSVHASKLSRRLAIQISVALTSIMFALSLFYVWQSRKETITSLVSSNTQSLSYWMMVGDTFEITRALKFMVTQPLIKEAALYEAGSHEQIASAKSDSTEAYTLAKLRSRHPVHSNSGTQVGVLEIMYVVSAMPFLFPILLGIMTFFVVSPLLERKAKRLTDSVLRPVTSLVDQVGRAKTLSDLSRLDPDGSPFIEITKLTNLIHSMGNRVEENERSIREMAKNEAIYKLTRQVAHDIRSPLSALKILSGSAQSLSGQEKDLINAATSRIEKLADDMLSAGRKKSDQVLKIRADDLSRIAKETLKLKAIELSDHLFEDRIESHSSDLVVLGRPEEFQNILSNIMNNAAEASDNGTPIVIQSIIDDQGFEIVVSDQGSGIPESLLRTLGTEGVSTKKSGHGYGLWHAKSLLHLWNGELKISTEVNKGTSVSIRLARAQP